MKLKIETLISSIGLIILFGTLGGALIYAPLAIADDPGEAYCKKYCQHEDPWCYSDCRDGYY